MLFSWFRFLYVHERVYARKLPERINTISDRQVLKHTLFNIIQKSNPFFAFSTFCNSEFGAVSESELFSALEEVVKKDGTLREDHDVATIFSTWSRQAGFPLVTVERNYANADIRFSQERYLNINGTSVDPSIWWIPINYAFASEPDFKDTAATGWFRVRSHVINDPGVGSTDWFLLNKRQTGYYRVKYDLRNYRLLADQLDRDFEVIHLTSRSQLIDDAFDLARYERLTYDVAFDLIKYMVNEVEFVPWVSAFRGLQVVDRLLAGSPIHQEFKVDY